MSNLSVGQGRLPLGHLEDLVLRNARCVYEQNLFTNKQLQSITKLLKGSRLSENEGHMAVSNVKGLCSSYFVCENEQNENEQFCLQIKGSYGKLLIFEKKS